MPGQAKHPLVKSDGSSTPRQIALAIIRLQQQLEEIIKMGGGGGGEPEPVLPPDNIGPPEVSGNTIVGSKLICSTGVWTNNPTSYNYVWYRGDTAIGSSSSYVLRSEDVGYQMLCTVRAFNSGGGGTIVSSSRTSVVTSPEPPSVQPPVLISAPVISGSGTLTTTNGTWSNSPTSYSYQWKRNGANIATATNPTYVTSPSDIGANISSTVMATNSAGSAIGNSNIIVPTSVPTLVTAPAISGSLPSGSTLTTTNGTWNNSPTSYTYQWRRSGNSIVGATNSTYITTATDVGVDVTCAVTAHNATGPSNPATSNTITPTSASVIPTLTAAPAVTPTAEVTIGTVLTTTNGTWAGAPTSFARQWQRDATNLGATGLSYTAVAGDVGTNIRCQVIASNDAGSSSPALSNAVAVAATGSVPVNSTVPAITGTPQVGINLICDQGVWSNAPTGYAYQWQRATTVGGTYSDIAAATSNSLTVAAAQEGEFIKCRVTASNAAGAGSPALTVAVGPVAAAGASPFVFVYPSPFADTTGKTIKRPGVGGVGAFNVNTGNAFNIGNNEIWDLRGMTATVHENSNSESSFNCNNGPASSVVCGGKSTSSNSDYFGTTAGASWKDIHGNTSTGSGASGNYASLYFNGPCAKGFRVHGFYCKRNMDGIVPKDETQGAIVENSVFTEIRDDVIQDDPQNDFTFRGCLLQGHVIFSWRPGGGSPAGKSGRIMTVENCLIHLDRMMYLGEDTAGDQGSKRTNKYFSPSNRNNTIVHPGAGMGSKWIHKTHQTSDAGGLKIRYIMKNVLIRIDTPSVDGINEGEMFPNIADGVGPGSNNGSYYENVHVCWLGPNYNTSGGPVAWNTVFANTGQTKASLLSMGITIHDGATDGEQAVFDYWMTHYNAFQTAHGYQSASDTYFHQRMP